MIYHYLSQKKDSMKNVRWIISVLLLSVVASVSSYAQRSGIVTGNVMDGSVDAPLAFANVFVKGTSIGTVTDEEGNFRLDNVPAGDQIIVFSFIGFADQEVPVTVEGREVRELAPITMTPETIMGEEVVVTAIMRGQVAAINKQVNSNTIVNVVSKDKIEDVPDVNAAESISRLPGITISRSAGEGSKVTVRGVSPRFNTVTVNGLAIPATGSGDRSVDLSMVSSDILEGIEVYKALTPDMDADAVGGSVNLVTKTADPGFHGRVQLETGYHGLIKGIGTYKGSLTLGNRFFNDKVGLLGTFTYHNANRNSDEFDASYIIRDQDSEGNPLPSVGNVYLTNNIETRVRYNASLTADYKMKSGQIVFDYFYTQTNRDVLSRELNMSPGNSALTYSLNHRYNDLGLHSFQLRGNHDLKKLIIDYSFSHSRIINETPISYGTGALKSGAFTSDLPLYAKPQEIPQYTRYDIDDVIGGSGFGYSDNRIDDKNYTGQVDLKVPLYITSWLNGYIKTGAKIRQKSRVRDLNSYGIYDGVDYYNVFIKEYPDVRRLNRDIYMDNFIDREYEGYTFAMGTQYVMPYVLDDDIIREHYDKFSGIDSLWWKNPNTAFDEFDAFERVAAGYVMAEFNIGPVMILPGIRYEQDYQEYSGTAGFMRVGTRQFVHRDTTGNRTLGHWLPMFHVKISPFEGFSIRLAATKTLTRPDFLSLTPFERINYGGKGSESYVERGSLDLKLPTAWSYDAFVNYYSRFGLVSVGAFYKEIQNVDIDITYRDLSGTAAENPTFGMQITNPINSEQPTTVWGMEFEIQTNFRWLPKPFDGIVLNANYSLVRSETYFPFFPIIYPPPDYLPQIKDTARVNRLPGQANDILNVTLGYEKKGFSARVSVNFQGNKLTRSGGSEFLDRYSADYLRWDAIVTQKIGERWMIILNLINFTNEPERSYMWAPENPTQEQYYGWAANLGVRFDF